MHKQVTAALVAMTSELIIVLFNKIELETEEMGVCKPANGRHCGRPRRVAEDLCNLL